MECSERECIWLCTRGRTRLECELFDRAGDCDLEIKRNSRLYGSYQFAGREAALAFAGRLKETFAANGWVAAA